MVDYASLFSRNLPRSVATPVGSSAQVKYIFSVTNAVPEVIDADEYLTAIAAGMAGGGAASLAGYPPTGGHVGLRELIAPTVSYQSRIQCLAGRCVYRRTAPVAPLPSCWIPSSIRATRC